MSKHWDQYWKQGHLTSFGDSFEGNYTGVLHQAWNEAVEMLPEQFDVLDIATGNGAIPLLLKESLLPLGKSGQIIGVDLAQVNQPENDSSSISIELLSNINCCDLPFEAETFDVVTSQFGIEYAPLNDALAEALRVLKAKCRLQLIVHHSESMVIRRNRRIVNLISGSLVEQVLNLLGVMTEQMGELRSNIDLARIKDNPESEQNRLDLNRLIGELVKLDEDALKDSDLMTYVATLFKTGIFWSVSKKKEYLRFITSELLTLEQRLTELVNASVTQDDLASIINSTAKTSKLEEIKVIRTSEFDEILAWKVVLCKH